MVNLLFGVHNHQPSGNFTEVFKEAVENCYRPFIQTLYNYPDIKATVHFSGSLVDWLLNNQPELLSKVKEMVQRKQVEILTGGYYEPILPIIPERDRLGQINMLSGFIQDYFETEPEGAWIGERVWQPDLAKSLVMAKVQYVLLDDFHFLYSGIKKEKLKGYFITREQGYAMSVFPINTRLRYIIPFSMPAKPIAYLKNLGSKEGEIAVVIVDDGEKFGLWPGTDKWVYEEKWLENFFQLIIKNKDWLKTQTISEYMHQHKAQGNYHLKSASYEEMMSWCGGKFDNFFVKYPEANSLYQRMLYVSEKLNREKRKNEQARKHLYKGQCNCPYWHGVFGGLYLTHLRHFAYKNLILAEKLLEQRKESSWIETEVYDFNNQGSEDLIVKNPRMNLFLVPRFGGSIFELDYLPQSTNIMDTLTRRREAYHEKLLKQKKKKFFFRRKSISSIHDLLQSKERNLDNFLIYDVYRRTSLLDHFFDDKATLDNFSKHRCRELGDFINASYSVEKGTISKGLEVVLSRQGKINYKDQNIPLALSKKLFFNDHDTKITIEYKLAKTNTKAIEMIFGIEFNFSLQTPKFPNALLCKGQSQDRELSLEDKIDIEAIEQLRLVDKISGLEVAFSFNKGTNLWSFPLQTVSASEEGFERNYQQTVIFPYWRIILEKDWTVKIELSIADI